MHWCSQRSLSRPRSGVSFSELGPGGKTRRSLALYANTGVKQDGLLPPGDNT